MRQVRRRLDLGVVYIPYDHDPLLFEKIMNYSSRYLPVNK
jgi:hypothetical protein